MTIHHQTRSQLRRLSFGMIAAWCCSPLSQIQAAPSPHFEKEIWPIIKDHCVKCHQPKIKNGKTTRPKGQLRLDSARGIMLGSHRGAVVVPRKPDQSSLYTSTTLDEDDDDVMPSKGELLTLEQQSLLKAWIASGASFGSWHGAEAPPTHAWDDKTSTRNPRTLRIQKIQVEHQPLSTQDIAQLKKAPWTTWTITAQNKALEISIDRGLSQASLDTMRQWSPRIFKIHVAKAQVACLHQFDWSSFSNLYEVRIDVDSLSKETLEKISKAPALEHVITRRQVHKI